MRFMIWLIAPALLAGCKSIGASHLPKTLGESASNYGYVPLDPLAVSEYDDVASCNGEGLASGKIIRRPLLESLPDLAVRYAVASLDTSGGLTFGASKITEQGQTYRAVLDYINVDVVPADFYVRMQVQLPPNAPNWETPGSGINYKGGERIIGYETVFNGIGYTAARSAAIKYSPQEGWERIVFPVYIGVGMRLTADIQALKGGINLSGLSAIGVQAEVNHLSGSMTVQTLGVNGKQIAVTLPLPNKLDQSTVENGILAIGSTRAMLYATGDDTSQMRPTPRVVGLYSPIGSNPKLINALYSQLSDEPLPWPHPCDPKPAAESAGRPSGARVVPADAQGVVAKPAPNPLPATTPRAAGSLPTRKKS